MFEAIIGADYPKKVIPLIKSAKKNIDIIMYDWRWYMDKNTHPTQQFNIALVNAKNRGVQIRAILNRGDILEILKKVGIKARVLRDRRTVHTKLIIIDDEIVVIGSHNFTSNAFTSNVETSVIVNIPEGHKRLRDFYENLYQL